MGKAIYVAEDKRKSEAHLFKPGQTGNPNGRPKGSKHKLNEDFLKALAADFHEHGPSVIANVRTQSPAVYLKIVAGLQPREVKVTEQKLDDMSDEEVLSALETIRTLKAKIADRQPPSEPPLN